jgi:hypothetical protein
LQTSLQEILNLQSQHVIKLHSGFVEDTDTHETANQSVAFEEALGIFLVQSEKLTMKGFSDRPSLAQVYAYRAARRILERVSSTRHTSRLFLKPYSPTVFNSESLSWSQFMDKRHEQRQAHVQWPGLTYRRALSKAISNVSKLV